jgi:hypothetical protein
LGDGLALGRTEKSAALANVARPFFPIEGNRTFRPRDAVGVAHLASDRQAAEGQGVLPALAQAASLSAIQIVTPWNLPVLNGVN